MAASKELRKLLAALERQKFVVVRSKKNHFKVYKPSDDGTRGPLVGTVGGTPSDRRSGQNTIMDLRKSGFTWEGK